MRIQFSYANVVATLALCFALTGTAVAAKVLITSSKQVKDGALTGADIKNGSITKKDLAKDISLAGSSSTASAGAAGPQGAQGLQGPQGLQGDQGLAGLAGSARAYALVDASGVVDTAKSKGITAGSVTNVDTGVFCISPPSGIDVNTVEPVVILNRNQTNTTTTANSNDDFAFADIDTSRPKCGGAKFEVRTSLMSFNMGSYAGNSPYNGGFFIIIP